MLKGAIAAALTPLRDGRLDADAMEPYLGFLEAGGLDGALAMGTAGEGVLFELEERKQVASAFVHAAPEGFDIAVHAGMQTTRATAELAAYAAEIGADAVAVIPPPYFPLDDDAVFAHLSAAAAACAPVPFYVYEFEKTSGYAVSKSVLERLQQAAPNFVGMKVSDSPWEPFSRYIDLGLGLDVFVGPEALIGQALEAGAVGSVSALASAFPERVAAAVAQRSGELAQLRAEIDKFPRHAAMKRVVARRGVPMTEEVRLPLRALTSDETRALDALLDKEQLGAPLGA